MAGDKFCAGTSHITVADIAFLSTFSTFKVRKKEDHGCKQTQQYTLVFQAGDVSGVDLSTYTNIVTWFDKCVKLIPNYEKANGEGAAFFGGYYKSKC